MPTPRQIILSLLTDCGAQDLRAIVLECQIKASEPNEESSVRGLLARLIEAGDVFTDGKIFASHVDEISPHNVQHCTAFLLKAFD